MNHEITMGSLFDGIGGFPLAAVHCGVKPLWASEIENLIRRLTPLEAERLQGFPDFWTDIPDASDSARYKALGNSVAIPCVDYVVNGMATILRIIPGLGKEISSLIII